MYELSYKNPSYLLKTAELEARLGRKSEALDALKKAFAADGGLPAAQYFAMVDTLNRWGFLEEAKPFIDEGWKRFTERSANDAMGGRGLLRSAVESAPDDLELQGALELVRARLYAEYRERMRQGAGLPRVRVGGGELLRFNLPPDAGFVLSLVDGHTRVDELVTVSGMDPFDVLHLLGRLEAAGIVEIAS